MEGSDSCIIVGTRKSLPKVFIASESESDSGGLRQRYSSGSSSLGSSSGSPNTPPCSTSTPHSKATLPKHYGISGCINSNYGSFQPTSYTDAYVPPLSLDREEVRRYQSKLPYQNKSDEVIKIDSGYGKNTDDNDSYFMSRRHLSFNTSSSPSLWDSLVTSPIQSMRQKIRGRPSYVDEGSSSNSQFKVKPQQILACLIFTLVLISIVMILMISYKHFNNSKDYEKQVKINLEKEVKSEQNDAEIRNDSKGNMPESLLLKDDVTIEEVEKMREELKAKIVSQSFPDPEVSLGDAESEMLSKLAVSVEELLSLDITEDFTEDNENELEEGDKMLERDGMKEADVNKEKEALNQKVDDLTGEGDKLVKSKKRSKNSNPLTKSVHANKKSKARKPLSIIDPVKVEDAKEVSLDYPDDPTFRGRQNVKRIKRDEEEGENQDIGDKFRKYKSGNGDKFRKYKDDNDGGFRKKGSAESGRE